MALSGNSTKYNYNNGAYTTTKAPFSYFYSWLEWSGVQNTAGNYTDVTVTFKVHTAEISKGVSTGNIVNVNAFGYTGSIPAKAMYSAGDYTFGSTVIRVYHNPDGTKSGTITAEWLCAPLNYAGKNLTEVGCQTDTVSLNTIARASILNSVTDSFTTEGNFKVNYTSYGLTTNLVIKQDTITIKTINNVASGTNYTFTSSEKSALYQIMSKSSATTLTFNLMSYSGSTLVGTSSKTATCTIPSYTINWGTQTLTDDVTTYNTYKPTSNTFIAYLSKPKLTFSAASSTGSYYGNSLKYYLISSSRTQITSPYIYSNFTGQNYSLIASDGRKDSTSWQPNMVIVPYQKPNINVEMIRPLPTGNTAIVNVTMSFYDGNDLRNLSNLGLNFSYTEAGSTEQTKTINDFTLEHTETVNHITTNVYSLTLTGLDYKKPISYGATISDLLQVTATMDGLTLPKGLPVFNCYENDDGENVFNINGNLSVNNNMTVGTLTSKNLFNIHDVTFASTVYEYIDEDTISINYGDGATGYCIFNKIDNYGGPYNISDNGSSGVRILIRAYDTSNNIITNLSIPGFTYNTYYKGYYKDNYGGIDTTFTLPSRVAYFNIGLISTASAGTDYYKKILLEKGNVATEYSKYQDFSYISNHYSVFAEINTGKKWTDGKPIYRKVVKFYNTAIQNNTSFAHNISNIDTITNVYGYMDDNGTHRPFPLFYNSGTATLVLNYYINKNNIIFVGNDSWGAGTSRINCFIIEYTKTSD